jgi:DNA-binding IclR family transcriptional regulator
VLGRRYPAYAGATGQVLLAHLDPEHLEAYLAEVECKALTERTVRSAAQLRLILARIGRAGVAASVGERVPDAIAVSAPVFDGEGRVACALTVSGVVSRWDRELTLAACRTVKAAAERVSRDVGYRPHEGEPTAAALEDPCSEAFGALEEQCDEIWQIAS